MAQHDCLHNQMVSRQKLIHLVSWRLGRIKSKHLRLPTPALSREINTDIQTHHLRIQSSVSPDKHIVLHCKKTARISFGSKSHRHGNVQLGIAFGSSAVFSISYCPSLTGHCIVRVEVSLNKHPDSDFSDRRFRNAFRGITNCSLTLPCIYHILSAEV